MRGVWRGRAHRRQSAPIHAHPTRAGPYTHGQAHVHQTRVPFPFPRSPVRGTSRHQLMPRFYAPRKQFEIEGAVQECLAVPVLEDLSLKGTCRCCITDERDFRLEKAARFEFKTHSHVYELARLYETLRVFVRLRNIVFK